MSTRGVHLRGIFAGCNRDPATADWCHELDLVAFAAASTVCIYAPARARVICSLRGHDAEAPLGARINAVHWLPTSPHHWLASASAPTSLQRELVSASADRTVCVWLYDARTTMYACTATLRAHESAVQAVSVHASADGALLLASVGGDRTVRLWTRAPLPRTESGELVRVNRSEQAPFQVS